jgi:hypothetical protein
MTTLAATAAALLAAALMILAERPGISARHRLQCPPRRTRRTPASRWCHPPGQSRQLPISATACRPSLTSPARFPTGANPRRTGCVSEPAKPSRSDARRAAVTRSPFAGQPAARNGGSHLAARQRVAPARVLSAAANVLATADLVLLTQWACAPAAPRPAPRAAPRTGGRR